MTTVEAPAGAGTQQQMRQELVDFVLDQTAELFAGMLAQATARPEVLDLVPTGLPVGAVDAALRAAIGDRLSRTAFIASAADPSMRIRAGDAALNVGL